MERYVAERFSNPAIILFGDFNGACISAVWVGDPSPEHGVFAAAPFVSTGVFYPGDEALVPFLDALSFDGIPKGNLRAYFDRVAHNILLSKIVSLLGGFPDYWGGSSFGGTCRKERFAKQGTVGRWQIASFWKEPCAR